MIKDLYFKEINKIIKSKNLSNEDILKNYLSFVRRRDLTRLFAHYEMFKLIKNLPGSIVEVGIYLGSGLFTWANLLETFCAGDRNRLVFGFDNFQGYKNFSKEDKIFKNFVKTNNHLLKSDFKLVQDLLRIKTNDNILKGIKRAEIINGDISKSIIKFKKKRPGIKISLLYLDVNLYKPTKKALDELYELVVPRGIIAFNGYGQLPHEGEVKALDDFISKKKIKPEFKKFSFSSIPSVYFRKN